MSVAQGIPDVEKKVTVAALLFAGAMLALIAYAALRLGISVPGCVTNVKPFSKGELIQVAPGRYEAHVVSKMFAFKPSPLKVPKGSGPMVLRPGSSQEIRPWLVQVDGATVCALR